MASKNEAAVIPVLLAVALGVASVGHNTAYACSCFLPRADMVFEGRVVSVTPPTSPSGSSAATAQPGVVDFEVHRVWQGPHPPRLRASLTILHDMCASQRYEVGQRYVVYLTREGNQWAIPDCDRPHHRDDHLGTPTWVAPNAPPAIPSPRPTS